MMISCEKAAKICCKTQYREATLFEKIQLNFHLIICRTCKAFSKKNKLLTGLCEEAELKSLSQKEKEEMKQKLQEKI